MQSKTTLLAAALPLMIALVLGAGDGTPANEWKHYGGPDNIRYSPLRQIDRTNVARLQVAWTFDTGDAFPGSEMQCHPLVIGGVLYGTTPKGRIIALDAATGALRWSFDPGKGTKAIRSSESRGHVVGGRPRAPHLLYLQPTGSTRSTPPPASPRPASARKAEWTCAQGLGRDPEYVTISAHHSGRNLS